MEVRYLNQVQAKLIEQIEENEGQLSDWERKFIDDIQKNDYTLSEKQNSIIIRIHCKVVVTVSVAFE